MNICAIDKCVSLLKRKILSTSFKTSIFLLVLSAAMLHFSSHAQDALAKQTSDNKLTLQTLISDLPASWAINVSPDNFLYVTHRAGVLAKYSLSGTLLATIDLQLNDLYHKGQGGLSAIAFHPDFARKPWIYLSYSYGSDSANGLKVIRVLLSKTELASEQVQGPASVNAAAINNSINVIQKETIYEQAHLRATPVHYGARLAFMADNSLLISTGDGFDYREQAQVKSSDMGKILRLTDTGNVPSNNPFASANTFSEQAIYSMGHRNPQGLIVLPNNQVIAHEHGPAGGDEINIIEAALNYGWPVITQGKDYIGSLITPFTEYAGMQQPVVNWTPSIAPSGMVYYDANTIQAFANRLLITSLKFKQLHSLAIKDGKIEDEIVFFADSQYRMRDIASSKNGRVFILSDGEPASIFEVVMMK